MASFGISGIDYNSIFEDINDLERTIPSKPNLGIILCGLIVHMIYII